MPRSGEVGEQTFEHVERLTSDGMSRTDAFKRVADETGRREGTVAANYYRVARKRAGANLGQRQTANGRARRGGRSQKNADVDALARAVVESVQALAAAVSAQTAEMADMRRRIDEVRRALR